MKMKDIQLYRGDCLEIMKNIPDKSVDMILCDLPYGTTNCKWDQVINFEKLWEQYNRIIKNNGAIILFGSEPFSSYLRLSNIEMYRYDWIWQKTKGGGFALANKQPLKRHETISVFYKKQPTYNPIKFVVDEKFRDKRKTFSVPKMSKEDTSQPKMELPPRAKDDGTRFPISVLQFKSCWGKGQHPTQKPVDLLEYLIKTYTNEEEIVLDNCMGSGSTGVACVNTNRKFIGIELEEKYFEMARNRIEEAQNNKINIK